MTSLCLLATAGPTPLLAHGQAASKPTENVLTLGLGAALGYRAGRKDRDTKGLQGEDGSDYLRGMGDIKGAVTSELSLGYAPLT
ncbi:hypothetical protein G5S34_04630 [Herbaspirillum frisingense]|uniref:hypothetical protein n=1 Tax=Herbaspirillum frisingense TaxID=92645 RepID=UPI00160403DC|nr:hypothetical protein [Herbaspirillum frisingense]QNB06125.1 hypothetical protein G5S34_04630 [Herbaspirillum frisingense]